MDQRKSPVGLVQVHPDGDNPNADIDIIAIHGLDTTSADTWTWRDRCDRMKRVNWLKDPKMLPSKLGHARIFTCDWPADLFQKSTPTTLEESAHRLLGSIRHHLAANGDRPILFIASCLGGIILIKALKIDDTYDHDKQSPTPLRRATRGIIFLATPFRGSAFESMSGPIVKAWASLHDQTVSALIDYTKEPTSQLNELIDEFIHIKQAQDYYVFTFHESKPINLLKRFHLAWIFSSWMLLSWSGGLTVALLMNKFSPWLFVVFLPWLSGFWSCQPSLGIGRQQLERTHGQMNKFSDPDCKDYIYVASKIEEIAGKICKGTLLKQADALVREAHCNEKTLRIERLSGDKLSIDQCYINLAIVEQSNVDARQFKEGSKSSSPFSLFARQKVETPSKEGHVDLQTIFNQRLRYDGHTIQPRRILIRGRAGVGKTTLCKRIVYEFFHGRWGEWSELFDRILWVRLRNLKLPERRQIPGYNFEYLFIHEYFSLKVNRQDLAIELARALKTKNGTTLFLLDGLDEVSQYLGGNSDMSHFLVELLNQPNVIITTRPSTTLSADVHRPDLELETIGFYPDQVKAYIEADPNMRPKANDVQSFLQRHQLVQGLVRIPIQLDALCFSWAEFDLRTMPDTMTHLYQAIERRLWKKDALRLGKKHEGNILTDSEIEISEVEHIVSKEIYFLEILAFTGLLNDVMDFTPEDREVICKQLKPPEILRARTLPQLSFLRTSDSSLRAEHQTYHFIHLTFQEYFAARYFVRKWKETQGVLDCLQINTGELHQTHPVSFLQRNKYAARYDVFWRFTTGLLDANGEEGSVDFFNTVETEPLDLLGPTHQRLIMHCLSEISGEISSRTNQNSTDVNRAKMELRLSKWLLFQFEFMDQTDLASEMEFQERALVIAWEEAPIHAKTKILRSIMNRVTIPSNIQEETVSWLQGLDKNLRSTAVQALGGRSNLSAEIIQAIEVGLGNENSDIREAAVDVLGRRPELSDETLQAIAARLGDEDSNVRWTAVDALGGRSELSDETLQAIVAWLGDEHSSVRQAAVDALGGRSELSDETLQAIVAWLGDEHSSVRRAAVDALGGRSELSDETLQAIAARLGDEDSNVREAAVDALGGRSELSDETLQAIAARLGDEDSSVRRTAVDALGGRSELSDETLQAIAARLGDEHSSVRRAAVDALGGRSELSDEILQDMASLLEKQDVRIHDSAELVLRKHGYRNILGNRDRTASLYKLSLKLSFKQQLTWCMGDNSLCINFPEETLRLCLLSSENDFRTLITETTPEDLPAISSRGKEPDSPRPL